MIHVLKTLLAIWRGESANRERKLTEENLREARQSITDARAMLDGEDSWLIPPHYCRRKEPTSGEEQST